MEPLQAVAISALGLVALFAVPAYVDHWRERHR
jgi:hypothetical protein